MMNEDVGKAPVTVLESSDPAVLAVAESLLEEAGIEFFAKGEEIQDLFGGILGAVQLQVAAADADEATAVLRELKSPASQG
jgi:putative signal transducing protein